MKTNLSIREDKILINGRLTYSEILTCPEKYYGRLMNARFIQGVFDDAVDRTRFNRFGKRFDPEKNTEDLIAALPEWYAKGLRAFTVGFQGGGTCFTFKSSDFANSAFSADGKLLDPAYLARMKCIIEAADDLGMIVIVSFYYVGQCHVLEDDMAVLNGVKTASNWLRDEGFTNVIIEIANEHDVKEYNIHPILFDEKGIAELIRLAQRESGGMLVGCSTTGAYFSEEIGNASDIILIHGNNQTRQQFHNQILEARKIVPARPIVCNEDSQALSNMQTALDMGISWGYYNNMTKQEPPTNWGITKGEDAFFANRMAKSFGLMEGKVVNGLVLDNDEDQMENHFYLQGLEKDADWEGRRWIRLASEYPERIHKVDFYRNGVFFDTAYDDPFTIHFLVNWYQLPTMGIEEGEEWKAIVTLSDGTVIEKTAVVGHH